MGVMRHRRFTLVLAGLAALGLTGCSAGADGTVPLDDPAAEAPVVPEPEPAPGGAHADLPEAVPFVRTPGPLEEIMATIAPRLLSADLPHEERDARFAQQARNREIYVAACMHAQGFDFVPNPDPVIALDRAVRDDIEPGTREFVLDFGLSITNPAWYVEITGSDGDPNEELLATMSDAHREAWDRALHGDADVQGDWGCWGAGNQAFQGGELFPAEEFAGLADEANALLTHLDHTHQGGGNPIEDEWSACMVAAGHRAFHSPTALRHAMEAEFFGGVADLQEFAAREFAAAKDSFRCEVQVDLHERSQEWQHERQAEFVEQHRAELEAWLLHATALQADG